MAPKSRPVRHALEYAAARALVAGLAYMPLGAAAWTGRRLGDLLRLIDRRHRERARNQAAERLGLSGRELDDFVRANFHSYGMTVAEFARLSRMDAADFRRYVDLGPLERRIRELRAEGKGLILITAHFGNWEWSNSTARAMGVEGGAIARPLDNPRLNEYVRRIRERNGLRILDKQGAIRKALGHLRANNLVGILIDQDAGPGGTMSPFLGRPASTIAIPVELAIRTACPMIVFGLRRGGSDKRFTVFMSEQTYRAAPDADPGEETKRLLDAVNACLGDMIMQAPEQWFWIHRRWKSEGKT